MKWIFSEHFSPFDIFSAFFVVRAIEGGNYFLAVIVLIASMIAGYFGELKWARK